MVSIDVTFIVPIIVFTTVFVTKAVSSSSSLYCQWSIDRDVSGSENDGLVIDDDDDDKGDENDGNNNGDGDNDYDSFYNGDDDDDDDNDDDDNDENNSENNNNELTQQDGRGKKMTNLVRQAW